MWKSRVAEGERARVREIRRKSLRVLAIKREKAGVSQRQPFL